MHEAEMGCDNQVIVYSDQNYQVIGLYLLNWYKLQGTGALFCLF